MLPFYSINGELVPSEDARLHVHDLGLLRGYGIFDFMSVRKGVPVFIEDYLNRFTTSAREMELDLPFSEEKLTEMVFALIAANGREDAFIRFLLTGGESTNGYTPERPTLVLMEHEYELFTAPIPNGGIKLMLEAYTRDLATIKTTSYFHAIRLQKKMKSIGASDVLYHDGKVISESSRSNFFLFTKDSILITPERNILQGVTRKHLIEVASSLFSVEIRDVYLEELKSAKEAFLSSTTRGVLPVLQIDDILIGDGRPGPLSKRLLDAFQEHVHDYVSKYQPA